MKTLLKKYIPQFFLNWYHLGLVFLGAFIYQFPSKKLLVVGVTGTNGKSTVVDLVSRIFEEAGFKTASLSSIRFRIGDREWPNTLKMTMPGRFRLQKFLADAVKAGSTHAVIEVTSEGIKQWRHWGIDFDVGVLTNVTPEHIESHGSFEKYREAKAKLFRSLAKHPSAPRLRRTGKTQSTNKTISVVNLDDKNAEYFLRFRPDQAYGYSLKEPVGNQSVDYALRVTSYALESAGVSFAIDHTEFNLKLNGIFNIYNALAAICVGLSQNIDMGAIKRALESAKGVPGRFEIVISEPFTVIVDYAHTPDALKNVYETVKILRSTNYSLPTKTICVLGAAGGGRDRWKRPELGRLAAEYCDEIILTNEDPYDESPEKILEDVAKGISGNQNKNQGKSVSYIFDRREAVRTALSFARSGDSVVITGKGCEPWMMVAGGKRIPWDDRKVVLEELDKLEQK